MLLRCNDNLSDRTPQLTPFVHVIAMTFEKNWVAMYVHNMPFQRVQRRVIRLGEFSPFVRLIFGEISLKWL
jgi:hypothetical protein